MIGYGNNATNHDFYAYNAANQVWNGLAFVDWSDADYDDYRIAATQQGTSGAFTANAPSGTVRYELRERGASLALSYRVWVGQVTQSGAATLDPSIVGVNGQILEPIVIGDDYTIANGRRFQWEVETVVAIDTATLIIKKNAANRIEVTGNAADGVVTFELLAAHTTGREPGVYAMSMRLVDTNGETITPVHTKFRSGQNVELIEGY